MTAEPRRLRELPPALLRQRLASAAVALDYGAAMVRVGSDLEPFGNDLQRVYGAFVLAEHTAFADFHTEVRRGKGLRAHLRPQSRFLIDGIQPFDPFPREQALAHFEWGVNWCFAQRFNQYVLLHAGALALAGGAVIMAAPPGSGKSTLTAAMMLRGFRLLSDEFGVLCPRSGRMWPMLKPLALKNRSIDVIRDFAAEVTLGPVYQGTRKGDVAHLAPADASVDARRVPVWPRLVIFPSYREGAALTTRRLPGEEAFALLAFNSFNYELLGASSFNALADIIESCPAFALEYSRLDEAVDHVRMLLVEATEARREA